MMGLPSVDRAVDRRAARVADARLGRGSPLAVARERRPVAIGDLLAELLGWSPIDIGPGSLDRALRDRDLDSHVLRAFDVGGVVALEVVEAGEHVGTDQPVELDLDASRSVLEAGRIRIGAIRRPGDVVERAPNPARPEEVRALEQAVISLASPQRPVDRDDRRVYQEFVTISRLSDSRMSSATLAIRSQSTSSRR